jgi:hypothetical protein
MTFPVGDVHVPLDIAFKGLLPIHPDSGMNEIGAWLAVPESELDNLNDRTGSGLESGAKRSRIPQGLPFEFGPFFGEGIGWFVQEWRRVDA